MKSNIVGEKIKTLIQAKNLTLDEVTERSGLTKDQIQIIVESDTIPSLAPVIKIARALGVRLGTFLDDADEIGPIIHKKSRLNDSVKFSSQLSTANSHLDFYSLAASKTGRHMEPFIIDIKPSKDNDPILSSHEGEEFLYVLQGEVKIIYGKESYVLSEGDSIFYDSIVKHLVSAAGNSAAKILAVVYTPF